MRRQRTQKQRRRQDSNPSPRPEFSKVSRQKAARPWPGGFLVIDKTEKLWYTTPRVVFGISLCGIGSHGENKGVFQGVFSRWGSCLSAGIPFRIFPLVGLRQAFFFHGTDYRL